MACSLSPSNINIFFSKKIVPCLTLFTYTILTHVGWCILRFFDDWLFETERKGKPSIVLLCCYAFFNYAFFFINNKKFKQSPRKSLICYTISKQFAAANKRRKLNSPLREQAKTFFLHRKPKRNAHFWTCQFKSVRYIL